MILAVVSRGTSLSSDADARVDIALAGSTTVDAARERITAEATSSWKATRVAETTESEREATVTFALPGSSLDGFVNALRRQPNAESVDVSLEVDPDQLNPPELAADPGEQAAAPEPVTVQVNLNRKGSQGPMVTFIGALIVAAVAALALGAVWRRFRLDDYDDPESGHPPDGPGPQRRWISGT